MWCNEKSKLFKSTYAVQNHMNDKGHCRMKLEGDMLLECQEFYDFSSSYPDASKFLKKKMFVFSCCNVKLFITVILSIDNLLF